MLHGKRTTSLRTSMNSSRDMTLNVTLARSMRRTYNEDVAYQLISAGANNTHINYHAFQDAHVDEVMELLSLDNLGQVFTRRRRFHVVMRWVCQKILANAADWGWFHWDNFIKESTTHRICDPGPDCTTAKRRTMELVWNNANEVWKRTFFWQGIK